ncbi:imidazolonepropionase [Aliiglaciecola sp. CAU 1673]|uniref:imidazolonepropionase n=1 Tax=Aliiglaciecola sp. CAU 1673 TaxID=3032595 RepID=UPI0023DA7776|nr:imidazolonepropionase [Aliiglaciecola sp. CAU 1673]MDF2179185.1 imidazolonepropionase [Aliiglaciecola sp. CAU 1673]
MRRLTMQQVQNADLILSGAQIATLGSALTGYGIIENGALAIADGKILWVGKATDLPAHIVAKQTLDCAGKWLLPGFIDCHTHLVFAGNRADEFEQRLTGVSYAEIAKRGGGIRRTMTATREANEKTLLALAKKRAKTLLRQGVTCIEVKSGYGLDTETELKLLRVARRLGKELPVTIRTTFLGAHALPPEFQDNADGYIDLVCEEMLPQAHAEGLVDAVDVFCEGIGFNLEQTRRVFETARSLGLPVKLHAEQLSNLGGSELAAEFGALSVDHIEFLDEAGVKAIGASGTVATLLPGAFYFLKETQKPPIALLRQYKVPMALATDFNPGSSPICQLPLMLNMGCTLFGLTPLEALQGVTLNSARALGLSDRLGSITVGKQADILLMDISHPNQLAYEFGIDYIEAMWRAGQPIKL